MPKSCDDAGVTLILKPEKDIIRKEDDRAIFFMNKDVET